MEKIVECVPNFSEGRRSEVINSIREAAGAIEKIRILDCESDSSHNRMVLTFVGPPDQVKEAALSASELAVKLIDLTKHLGEHPRMGAVDVVPFIPLRNVSIEDCVTLADSFAEEFSRRCNVPVFLYERAARLEQRRNLADVREGEFEGLRDLIGKDPSRKPDYGPDKIHPTAGATAVGARSILIAYNVDLGTADVRIAKKIASQIREKNGGLPAVKALGFELKDRRLVQVSMNLTDYNKTPIHTAFEAVSKLAAEYGIKVVDSEIIGLVPQEALSQGAVHFLRLKNFNRDQIIENRLYDENPKEFGFSVMTLVDFSENLSSGSPIPGGGSASAYAGALAASLVAMVCRVTIGKRDYEQFEERVESILEESLKLKSELLSLVDKDAESYAQVTKALKSPRDTQDEKNERKRMLNEALRAATVAPASTLEYSYRVYSLACEIAKIGNKNATSDAESAIHIAKGAIGGSVSNIKLNLESLAADGDFVDSMQEKIKRFTRWI
ncbi:MAG: glutamate formimidoyltransferase [Nitrososphaerales archaeon]